jgi:hypothetical protein
VPSTSSDFARVVLGALALVALGGCTDFAGPIPSTEPVVDPNMPSGGTGGSTSQPVPNNMGGSTSQPAPDPNLVSFNEDVHPILVARCQPCHEEPDGALPGHGADDPEDAFEAVQGMSNNEPVYERILARASGEDGYMPPTSAGCEGPLGSLGCLTQAEYDTIALWVEQGAMTP